MLAITLLEQFFLRLLTYAKVWGVSIFLSRENNGPLSDRPLDLGSQHAKVISASLKMH